MPTSDVAAVILAAGAGTRMRGGAHSDAPRPKVLTPLLGRPMLAFPIKAAADAGAQPVIVVVGEGERAVRAALGSSVTFARQPKRLGTGDAVLCAEKVLADGPDTVLIMYGDTPLVSAETLRTLIAAHRAKKAVLTILAAKATRDAARGLGRIIRDANKRVRAVREERDCSAAERRITEINTGVYCVEKAFLFEALHAVTNDNAQGEYYLTDIVGIARTKRKKLEAVTASDPNETWGVNDPLDMARVTGILRAAIRTRHMLAGVLLHDPDTAYIDVDVEIGVGTELAPQVMLHGNTRIGANCRIGAGAVITDSRIDDGVEIKPHSVLTKAVVGAGSTVGPAAHLRPGAVIGKNCRIGNYVEVKQAVIGDGAKASHLTYIGDATIGKRCNIGCGVITCNYDGEAKHRTVIEDDVFVGSDTQLIAPVTIGRGAYIGSGSTITTDVPPGALAVARERQRTIEGWAQRRQKKRTRAS